MKIVIKYFTINNNFKKAVTLWRETTKIKYNIKRKKNDWSTNEMQCELVGSGKKY